MPYSALKLPPSSIAAALEAVGERRLDLAGERKPVPTLRHHEVVVQVAVADMAVDREAHLRQVLARSAAPRSRNAVSCEIGTARSCLTEPPACFSPSGIVSRSVHMDRRCASDWASTALVTHHAPSAPPGSPPARRRGRMRADEAVSSRRTAPPGPAFSPVMAPPIASTRPREEAEMIRRSKRGPSLPPHRGSHLGDRRPRRQFEPGGGTLPLRRPELEHHARHDAEGALRADIELLQVVADVEFLRKLRMSENSDPSAAPLRGRGRGRGPCRNAGPGGRPRWCRDCRRAGRFPPPRAEGHEQACRLRRALRLRQDNSGVAGQGEIERVVRPRTRVIRSRLTTVAAAPDPASHRRHSWYSPPGARGRSRPPGEAHEPLHLLHAARAQHRRCCALHQVAVVACVVRGHARIGQDATVPEEVTDGARSSEATWAVGPGSGRTGRDHDPPRAQGNPDSGDARRLSEGPRLRYGGVSTPDHATPIASSVMALRDLPPAGAPHARPPRRDSGCGPGRAAHPLAEHQGASGRRGSARFGLRLAAVTEAEARWRRFDPLLARLFPELETGRIDSALLTLAPDVAARVAGFAGARVMSRPTTTCR